MLERFEKLTKILLKHEDLWKRSVFKDISFTYFDETSELKDWFFRLSESQLMAFQEDDYLLLSSISPFFEDASLIIELINFSMINQSVIKHQPKCWDNDIPGRKAQQILAFSQSIGDINQPILEWCCGKQHLGRFLSELHQQASDGLEINVSLVQQAKQLAHKRNLETQVNTYECDVLSKSSDQFINKHQHAIALHACGGLHAHLLEKVTQHQVKRISFSPCCYHRFNHSNSYEPLSNTARKSSLKLTIDDLRLAVRETKTTSMSETKKRRQLQTWRLGFDCLQRDLRKVDAYLDTPSLSNTILQKDFKHFCLHLASLKELDIKKPINFDKYEKQGSSRFHQYERAELFRMVFRRALESWLVLDRALFLEEQGYSTRVGLFCSSDISPRNFFIDAITHGPNH
jgi:hypothetical protein